MNGAVPLAKSSSPTTPMPSGITTERLTSAPNPLTGSTKIGVATTQGTPPGTMIQGSRVSIEKSGSLSTVNGTVTERSNPSLEPVIVNTYSPLVMFMVSTTTAPSSSMDNICSLNETGAFAAFTLALKFTFPLKSLKPTVVTQAANGRPMRATSSGTLGRRVKSGVAQSLFPSRPAKDWMPLATTLVPPTSKDCVPKCR